MYGVSVRRGRGPFTDAGVTLVELLVVTSLLGVVMSIAYLLLGAGNTMSDQLQARSAATDENRLVMDGITSELRQAMEITDAGGAFLVAQPRQCGFYSDIDNDGAPELVKYRVQQGQLWRAVFRSTTQVAPFSFSATAASDKAVMSSLDSSWSGDIFTYYDNSDPPVVVAEAHKEDISAVAVHLINTATSGAATAHVDLSTWVKIRSIHNSID